MIVQSCIHVWACGPRAFVGHVKKCVLRAWKELSVFRVQIIRSSSVGTDLFRETDDSFIRNKYSSVGEHGSRRFIDDHEQIDAARTQIPHR